MTPAEAAETEPRFCCSSCGKAFPSCKRPYPFHLTLTQGLSGCTYDVAESAYLCVRCAEPLQDYLREKGILK